MLKKVLFSISLILLSAFLLGLAAVPALADGMASIQIVKAGIWKLDNTIEYTFTVTNTGTKQLSDVTVTDPLISDITGPQTWPSGTVGTLNPGESVVFTGSYTVTDDNIGTVTNIATASGKPFMSYCLVYDSDTITLTRPSHMDPLPEVPSGVLLGAGLLGILVVVGLTLKQRQA